MTSAQDPRNAQGGGYPPGGFGGPPPAGYGAPPGAPGGYGPGAPGGYGPPGGAYAEPGAPRPPAPGNAPGMSPFKKQAQTWLLISVLSSVFCTCCFGLIAAIFCYMAMQASDQGNSVDAESKLRWGKIITIVGLVLGAVLTVMSLVYARDLAEAVRAALLGAAP